MPDHLSAKPMNNQCNMEHRTKRPTANDLRKEMDDLIAPDPIDRPSMTAWVTADLFDTDQDQSHEEDTDTLPPTARNSRH
jgi:hypothetical protein